MGTVEINNTQGSSANISSKRYLENDYEDTSQPVGSKLYNNQTLDDRSAKESLISFENLPEPAAVKMNQ